MSWYNAINSTVVEYAITVSNDGNRALAPVYVRDVFPPATQFVSSSLKPTAPSQAEANWTLLHLGIGDSMTIELKLNLTEDAVVIYTITLKNSGNSSMAAVVTDEIPGGMRLQQSSIAPYSTDSNHIVWSFADIKPGEVRIIEYKMKASRNGAFTSGVHVQADAFDGSGSASADSSA